jgi:signal transduction histidine kinase
MRHLSLFTRILIWFLLSFAVLAGVAGAFFLVQMRADPDSAIRGRNTARMRAIAHLVGDELKRTSREGWGEVLDRYSKAYNARFVLMKRGGRIVAGPEIDLPEKVKTSFRSLRLRVRTSDPARVWLGIPMHLDGFRGGGRVMLVVEIDPNKSSGLFSDPIPWVAVVALIIILSVLLWLPLVRTLTRPIAQMTAAAERIAQGDFDARVPVKRSDEIGRLGASINEMASNLDRLVSGQKRFLGDVSHELRSPLTRIKLAMELVEATANEKQRAYLTDGLEEVDAMTELVGELLAVARAEVDPAKAKLQSVELAPLVERVAKREGDDDVEIKIEVPEGLNVTADPDLLSRAIGNLLRNAVRYASHAGPIKLSASREGEKICIEVTDQGPGVPDEALPKLFEPFYRPEADRDRDTGGTGLGTAIVKTCTEACGGTVIARNLKPGLCVRIELNG